MASPPLSPRRGVRVDLSYVRGSPGRKLRSAMAHTAAPVLHGGQMDRSYECILQEQRERILRAMEVRARRGLPCSPNWRSPTPDKERHGEARLTVIPAADEREASVEHVTYLVDQPVQVRMVTVRDAATITKPQATVAEQDAIIQGQREQIAVLEREIQRMRIAAKGRIDDHRHSLGRAQGLFYAAHKQLMDEGTKQRRVFETASLLSLRDMERDRDRQALRDVRREMRAGGSLSPPSQLHPDSSPRRCPSPAPAAPALFLQTPSPR
eukprot:TRINITY_DN67111_c0_g1_i1.p1 TRINITY_DN67111_c0_g1~~TRINITY_DN67111_c0_g1_i1.p1  ORF type:complete len:299 (+),score=99.56 TRINITY_DN67111_c0_g1_i1:97-897(+)